MKDQKKIRVSLGTRSYAIIVGGGVICRANLEFLKGADVLLVSDSNVARRHGRACAQALRRAGARVAAATVPAGEKSKSLKRAAALYAAAAAAGLDRRGWIAALGGGMVGDLAGFAAATYLRGVRLIQMPTSLLAMVDSSVGGKTAVNLPQGKNLVGAFYQPAAVLADLDLLSTLPEREYLSGFAEVIKYGVIADPGLLRGLERNIAALRRRDAAALAPVIARCCAIKARVVGADEREVSGLRAILNFGHTLAHALEKTDGYGRWLHGEAVAIGMDFALDLSAAALGLPTADAWRVKALLADFGLPLRGVVKGVAWGELRRAMAVDKKSLRRQPRFVLAERLGRVRPGCELAEKDLREVWHVNSK